MSARNELTAERLRELLRYDPDRECSRDVRERHSVCVSEISRGPSTFATAINASASQGGLYMGHRLAWLYMTGEWPKDEIDHINGSKADNRFANLREASRSGNTANVPIRADNNSGLKGVGWHKATGKWASRCRLGGKLRHLGLFDTRDEAYEAYCLAAREAFGEYARLDSTEEIAARDGAAM